MKEDFAKIKNLIVKGLAKQLDDQWEQFEKGKGWTQETYKGWRNEHMRTPYK